MGFLRDEQGRLIRKDGALVERAQCGRAERPRRRRVRELCIAAVVGRSVAQAYDAETARIRAQRQAVSARLHVVIRTVMRALARARESANASAGLRPAAKRG